MCVRDFSIIVSEIRNTDAGCFVRSLKREPADRVAVFKRASAYSTRKRADAT